MSTRNLEIVGNEYVDVTTAMALMTDQAYSFTVSEGGYVEVFSSFAQPSVSDSGLLISTQNNNFPLTQVVAENLWVRTSANASIILSVSEYNITGGGGSVDNPNRGYFTKDTPIAFFSGWQTGWYAEFVGQSGTIGGVTFSADDQIIADQNITGTPADLLPPNFTVISNPADSTISLIRSTTTLAEFSNAKVGDQWTVVEDVTLGELNLRVGEILECTNNAPPTVTELRSDFTHYYIKNIELYSGTTSSDLSYAYSDQTYRVVERFNLFDVAFVGGDTISPTSDLTSVPTDFTDFTLSRGLNRGEYSVLTLNDLASSLTGFTYTMKASGTLDVLSYNKGDTVEIIQDFIGVETSLAFKALVYLNNTQAPALVGNHQRYRVNENSQIPIVDSIVIQGTGGLEIPTSSKIIKI